MKNKTIIYVAVAIIIGLILGKNIYDGYAKEVDDVFNEKRLENIYLIQYGVYSTIESMEENTKKLKSYFYYNEDEELSHRRKKED